MGLRCPERKDVIDLSSRFILTSNTLQSLPLPNFQTSNLLGTINKNKWRDWKPEDTQRTFANCALGTLQNTALEHGIQHYCTTHKAGEIKVGIIIIHNNKSVPAYVLQTCMVNVHKFSCSSINFSSNPYFFCAQILLLELKFRGGNLIPLVQLIIINKLQGCPK